MALEVRLHHADRKSSDSLICLEDREDISNAGNAERGTSKVGSPQKAIYEVHNATEPWGLALDILISGQLMNKLLYSLQ